MSTARECIAKIIKENIGNRKLVAINRFVSLEEYLQENGINVFAHIYLNGTVSTEAQSVIQIEQLESNADKYYILVSSEKDLDFLNKFNFFGDYHLVEDYCTVQEMHKKIGSRSTSYHDTFNNRCNYVPENVTITFAGTNANIEFGKDLKITTLLLIIIYNDSKIIIGDDSEIKGIIKVQDNASINIDEKVRGDFSDLQLGDKCNLTIGKSSSFTSNVSFVLINGSVKVGNDCMFAANSTIFCGDGHPVYNVNTQQCINDNNERNLIEIGNHVWVGTRCIILSKTIIKDGSIVGAGSVVKGVYPNNCVIAGNPARMKKKDVAWSRTFGDSFDSINKEFVNKTVEDN